MTVDTNALRPELEAGLAQLSLDPALAPPLLEYLALLGRRGGSAVTVAAVNAIASTDERTNQVRA